MRTPRPPAPFGRANPPPARYDVLGASRALLASLVDQPWGQVSPSVYETGRLVSLAPWLAGHRARLKFLLATQRADGGWGGPGGYALVPTLSATEALLATAQLPGSLATAAAGAAETGLRLLRRCLRRVRLDTLPDTPAIEIIVPSLIALVNQRLRALGPAWRGARPTGRLPLPAGLAHAASVAIRAAVSGGQVIPEKLMHAIEIAGESARRSPSIHPAGSGVVGASPAATAAWLGRPDEPAPTPDRDYLADLVRRTGGPVPCCTPITVFERAWVISTMARAGLRPRLPRNLLASLAAALGERGTPGGDGLPADADTTAGTLFALAERGRVTGVECLATYELDHHFCTWPGEQGVSTSVNAHVLEAFGSYRLHHPRPVRAVGPSMAKVTRWLVEQQQPDGSWRDRWHASPFYATAACSLALDRYAGRRAARPVRAAVDWVLGQQRPDGAWGVWGPTMEETAYALQVLLSSPGPRPARVVEAAARGYAYLLATIDHDDTPALWHDKDLYRPDAIIRAAGLASIHLAQQDRSVMAFADRRRVRHAERQVAFVR